VVTALLLANTLKIVRNIQINARGNITRTLAKVEVPLLICGLTLYMLTNRAGINLEKARCRNNNAAYMKLNYFLFPLSPDTKCRWK
jgi:hypothetical protein